MGADCFLNRRGYPRINTVINIQIGTFETTDICPKTSKLTEVVSSLDITNSSRNGKL